MKKSKCILLLGILAISSLLLTSKGIVREANASPTSYDYVIITTNDIVAHSDRLEGFIRLKERFGYSVKVVTETDFDGLVGQAPNGRAEKIRQWLINNYVSQGIKQGSYVLLIGNPDSAVEDIPMKMCWTRMFIEPEGFEYPTDFFYADLTGNWDLDGDLHFGELTKIDNPVKPSSLSDGDTFSIKWNGELETEYSEEYWFRTFTDDGVSLSIDGDLIINDMTTHPPTINEASKSLSVGKHTIKLEYFENTGDAIVRLYWKSEHQTEDGWKFIPKELLFHDGSSGGLIGGYYDNMDFTDLKSVQVDETVDFAWLTGDRGLLEGVDFHAEVYVGRIPVYDDDYAQLDEILQKMIDYETVVGVEDLSWREKILLPTHPSDEVTYGWELHEQIKADIADPKGFAYYRIYSPGIDSPPTAPPLCEETPCTEQNVEDEWKNGYGMVTWFTHGGATGAGNVFSTPRCPNLDDTKPSFTFQASCSNAEPETETNLAYSLLKHGAVSTVGATRMSGFGIGWVSPSPKWGANQDLAYYYTRNIILDENPAGIALFRAKDLNVDEGHWGNLLGYNLYGDPACSLFKTIVNNPPVAEANGPYISSIDSTLMLDASGSYDPDGDSIKYEWDLNDDGIFEISTTNPVYGFTLPTMQYSLVITLRVTDILGASSTDTAIFIVFGVQLTVTPASQDILPGESAYYNIEVTNLGNVPDTYDISLAFDDFDGTYKAFPTVIQSWWATLDKLTLTLNPGHSDIVTLAITVPPNWAGMETATYTFKASATSQAYPSAKDTASAALQVQATKHSMAEYIRLEIQWLKQTVNSLNIKKGIKNSLLAYLADAEKKVDQAIQWINQGTDPPANNMLNAAQNILQEFMNEVKAQTGKAISSADAQTLIQTAQNIQQNIQTAKNTPIGN